MKKLFKRVPSKEYESSYDLSDALIAHIAKDISEAWSGREPMTAIEVALVLGAGETVMLASPFTTDNTEVRWSLEPVVTGNLKDDEAYLLEGKGEMWEVRVSSDIDDMNYVDFEVRAETMEEAADKAEAVAQRHSDMYFDEPPIPTYHAERRNIQRMDDEDEEIVYDREGPR